MGAIILQGPHHSAKKSTKTGFVPPMISPKVELFDMLFLFFERTENERPHQGKIGCAVDGTGRDAASA
jgi:hypothetical protein